MKKKPQPDPEDENSEPKAPSPSPDSQNPEPPDSNSQLPSPISQPEFTEETALAFFARHLDALKWKYRRLSDRPTLFSGFSGDNVQWDFNLIARASSPGLFQLAVNSFLPNKAGPARR